MKYRIKVTNEIVELRTWKRDDGAIKLVDKYGKMAFWPDEVEPAEQLGWHSASELPPEEGEYIAINNGMPGVFWVDYLEPFGWCVETMGAHEVVNVKYWCYPPKED